MPGQIINAGFVGDTDDRPIPLIVAARWGFALQHYDIGETLWYSVRDWIAGLSSTDTTNAAKMWSKMQDKLSTSSRQLA
jgi:hypothetical protein